MAGFPALTEAKRAAVAARLANGEAVSAIAKAEKVNPKTVTKLRDQAAGVAAPAHVLGGTSADRKIVRLEGEVARLRKSLREAHTERDLDDAVLDIIGDLKAAPSHPPRWLDRPAAKRGAHKHAEVPVLMLADWHGGEKVSLSETNGVNEYSLEILDRRVNTVTDTAIDLCRNHHRKDYPGIVIPLVGDFVSGALHPELAKTDELEVLPAVLWVLDRLEAVLLKMADEFGNVYVPCVAGNHGRNTMKPEFKRYAYKNFDWLIYQLLARRLAGDKRIQFQINDSNMAFFNVFQKRFALVHGDQMGVKGGDGIIGAIGPIMRGEIKVRGQLMSIGRDYDYLLLGHWHQQLWLPRAIVANALKGFDEYAMNALRAVPSVPSQPLFFLDPKWGITSRWEIYAETPVNPRDKAAWVSVPVFAKAA